MSNQASKSHQSSKTNEKRFILFTQCLQNDFFLNEECKLCLPLVEAKKLLVKKDHYLKQRKEIDIDKIKEGPLWRFLDAVIAQRSQGKDGNAILHVINIRDWHEPGPSYDYERFRYGSHCEKDTWGSQYIEGLQQYLDPNANKQSQAFSAEPKFFKQGNVWIYHIYSDSVFDFKARFRDGSRYHDGRYLASELEYILDMILLGDHKQFGKLANLFESVETPQQQEQLLDQIVLLADEVRKTPKDTEAYAAVIGVYTDIKVKTLLEGLRTRYHIENLAVSDTLTASPSLERHLGALDYFHKVLNVEVIHGLNNLISFLGGTDKPIPNERDIIASDRFSDFANYYLNKQIFEAYVSEKLEEHSRITNRRAEEVYETVRKANKFLIVSGAIFLFATLLGAALKFLYPQKFGWESLLFTGGLSLLQLIPAFFWRPMEILQKNLTNLLTYRMFLANHSLKTALARFHLTTPQTLREFSNAEDQVKTLQEQTEVIEKSEKNSFELLRKLGYGIKETREHTKTDSTDKAQKQ
jgi:hypothetical protein